MRLLPASTTVFFVTYHLLFIEFLSSAVYLKIMKKKHLKSLNLFHETTKFYKSGGEGGRGEGVVGVDYFLP